MCPYYKNTEVFNGFNEIVVALGGKPMTEEEFKSKELRHKREGIDWDAMEGAYRLWHFNNGNTLDYAPNGALSKLFSDLLELTGDRKKAIRAKSEAYTNRFISEFGNWIDSKTSSVDSAKQAILDTFNESKPYKEEINKLISLVENDPNITIEQAIKIFNAIRKITVLDEKVPGTARQEKLRIAKEAFGESEDKDFGINTVTNFINIVRQSDFFQNIYDLLDYVKNANSQLNGNGLYGRVDENGEPLVEYITEFDTSYQPPTTRVGEFGTQNDLMASDINEELTYSNIYEPPRTYKLDISTEDDLMMSQDDEKTVRDVVDNVSQARPHIVYNSNGGVKVQFAAQSKDHLCTVVKRALKEAGFKLGKIVYAGNKVRAEVTKAAAKKKSTVEAKRKDVTREEFYKYDMPLVEQERKEWEEFDKQYESPRTERKDISTNAEIMASALEDKREEYITLIGEKLTSALNLLYKSYQKQIGVITTSREETKTKLLEKINEVKQLREKDLAELALLSVLEWGKTVLGIVPRQGGTIDPRTAYGFLSKSNKDTDGEFTNIDPKSLWNLYVNTIGFFENTLLPLLPTEDDGWFSEDVYRDIDTITKSLGECKKLWVKAVKKVTTRYINDFIDKEVVQPQETKDNMKIVTEDWLTKNMFNGDIGAFNLYIANFGLNKNPIIKIAFHLIQYAETETNRNLNKLATPLAMKYKKADSLFRSGSFKRYASSSWQEIFMEKDRDGVPTGKFVRDINYGQYEIDLNEFVEQLNAEWDRLYGYHYIEDEYGYVVDTLNHFHAENQEWVEDQYGNLIQPNYYEYLSQIELWKDTHCDRRYTTLYYLERMSKPYRGYEDPATVKGELDGHGLSPKTLSKYRTIQNNINNYLSMCTDPDTGIAYPHKLGPTARKNLKYWQDMADDLSNPFEKDGQLKDYEDRVVAYEIRAWYRYLGQETKSSIKWDLFDSELEKIREEAQRENNPLIVDDFIQTNTKWGIHPDYFTFEATPTLDNIDVVHARLTKSALESLIKTDAGYTKDVALMENNPVYFLQYQRKEQLIASNRHKGNQDFAKQFNEHFVTKPILYRDRQGFYYTKNGVKLSSPAGISENSLMTWVDYLEEKYADDIVSGGTLTLGILINEMYLPNGLLKSKDQIKKLLHDFVFTYVDIVTNQDGTKVAVNKTIGALTLVMPKKKTFKNSRTGKVENTIIRVPKGTFAEKLNSGSRLISYTYNHEDIHPEQPLRSKYDNSKNLKKVLNEPVLADLYESLINVMKESYKKHAPERSRYDYDLPKVNADVGAIISRMISRGFKNTAEEIWKAMSTAQPNDSGMLDVNERIKSPDGSIGHSLPLRYVGKLKDRSTYSSDVVGAVIAYAHMAENYKNKYKQESILNLIASNLDPNVRKELNNDEPYRNSKNSKTLIDALLDSSLYENQYSLGEKQTPEDTPPKTFDEVLKNIVYSAVSMGIIGGVSFAPVNPILGAILGSGIGVLGGIGASLKDNVGNKKLAAFFQRTESLQMLGSNVLSMVVGIGDASVKMIREAINSKYMNLLDLSKSFSYVLLHVPLMLLNIGNPIPNCKIIAMMQMNGVSKDTKRIYGHMNYGRVRKILNNICLGGFSLLDYFTNSVLLKAHYNNIRFYEGNLVDKGYYTYQELKQAIIDKGYDNAGRRAKIAYLSTKESLWDAYTFNGGTIEGKMKGLKDGGMLQIRSDREQYVTNRHKTLVRTKTIQRGALYNGMNPDNDVPLYKRTFVGAAAGAMRGWLTLQIEHLFSGGDDTSVREFVKVSESDMLHGTEKVNPSTKLKPLTDKQLSEQMSWNYETGLPLDRIFMAILKSFDTLWKKAAVAIHIRKGNLKDIKFSYQEKYAWRNVLTTLGIMYVLMTGWPKYHASIKDEIPVPQTREEAGATSLTDVPRYMRDIYFGRGVYKLTLDDIYFRTIESLLTGIDPTTMWDVVNALSVYKSGVSELLEFVQSVGDAAGLTGHSSDEIIKRGSYKFYTRGERRLYKTYSLGQLDNLHTAFTYNGLWQNLNFYYNQYGKIYRFFGFDDFKVEKKAKESSGGRRGGSKRGANRGSHKRGARR